MRISLNLLSLLAWPLAQLPAQSRDTIVELPPIEVSVTRSALPLADFGLTHTSVRGSDLARGGLTGGFDQALMFVPGVTALNRWNWSVDQRLAIRGHGSRANFGVRGIQVVLDGVPQTLPDGQSQLTLVDLSQAERIVVARGPLGALFGNSGGGLVAVNTPARPRQAWQATAGAEHAGPAGSRLSINAGGGGQRLGGMITGSIFRTDGFRRHSAAEQRRMNASAQWQPTPATTFTARLSMADDPQAQNPGALTRQEYANDAAQAAPNNLLRRADKSVSQHQLSLGLDHITGRLQFEARAWLSGRSLKNPIAAPAPESPAPNRGLWIGLDRAVAGARATLTWQASSRIALAGGTDFQRMVDDRVNRAHTAGIPDGSTVVDQREAVTTAAPFAQLLIALSDGWNVRAGVRHDRTAFDVVDHVDPDATGDRQLAQWSGSAALAWHNQNTSIWLGAGSSFETPTTTELANRPDGSTGLNLSLDPETSFGLDLGIRHSHGDAQYELVLWSSATEDAITPFEEVGGRSFYHNVGSTSRRGVEAAVSYLLGSSCLARISYSGTHATFGDDAIAGDISIAGNRLPGMVAHALTLGIGRVLGPWQVGLDHSLRSGQYADDANEEWVDGDDVGITGLRISRQLGLGRVYLSVDNLLDRQHVATVVVNGGFGRFLEPGAGRMLRIGSALVDQFSGAWSP